MSKFAIQHVSVGPLARSEVKMSPDRAWALTALFCRRFHALRELSRKGLRRQRYRFHLVRVIALGSVACFGAALTVGAVAAASGPGTTVTTTTSAGTPRGTPLPNDPTVSTTMPVCGDQDGSESPLVFNCPQYTQVVDQRYYQVGGSGTVTVHFDYVYKDALCDNQVSVFKVDDASGSIGGVLPGDASWPSQVSSRNPQVIFGSGSSPSSADLDLTFQAGALLGFRAVLCGTTYYSFEQANPDGFDHLIVFQNTAGQPWQFAWEDTSGGGDHDFNDMVFNVSGPAAATLPPPLPGQNNACIDGHGEQAVCATGTLGDDVNTLTGAFTMSETDLTLASSGVPFTFVRSYTSSDQTQGRFGPGWADSYAVSLAVQGNGDVILHGDDGQEVDYVKQADGSFLGSAGSRSILAAVTGGYTLVRHDQVTYLFDANGVLESIVDRNDQGPTFAYTNGQMTSITDAAGHVITLTYTSGGGQLATLTTSDGRTASYTYTNGLLTSVTLPDPDGAGPLNPPVAQYTYDSGGRLASEIDPNGHTLFSNTYDSASGRVVQQLDANTKPTTFAWDEATQTATVTDADGHTWKDVYANGILVKRISGAGDVTQLSHDGDLNVNSVTSPNGTDTTTLRYQGGNLVSATAPTSLGSAQKTFTYDAENNVKTVTDARGKLTSYGYDVAGNLASITVDGQPTFGATYNAQGQTLTATDGNGKQTTYTYDTNGNVASVTDALGDKTTYTYNALGQVLTKVAPLGNCAGCSPANYTTTYTYHAEGRTLTETDPLGHVTRFAYDMAGNLTGVSDANGHTTSYQYDNANRQIKITQPDPDGAGPLPAPVTTFTYDDAGNRITIVDPRGNVPGGNPAAFTTRYTYDASNRLISMTTPKGETTSYTYDPDGNIASVVDPRGNVTGCGCAPQYTTTYSYDAAGRLLMATDPLGNAQTNHYDGVGNLDWTKDGNGHQTNFSSDAHGRILTIQAPDAGFTTYTYDGNGNLRTRSDANNHVTTYQYDDAGRLAQSTGPGSSPPVTTFTYDADSNLVQKKDPNANAGAIGTTTYTYDYADRLTNIGYSGTTTPAVSFALDAVGNRTSMTDGPGTITYTYDGLNRLLSSTRGSNTFSYTYNAAGSVTGRTYPDGTQASYNYDEDNRLASVASSGATTTYAYDPASNLTQTTLPAGNGYVETRVYDHASRLVEVKNAKGASILADFVATLDGGGNPTQVVQTGATSSTSSYTYDTNDRLTGVCFQAGSCPGSSDPFIRWTYDQVGNRLTESRPGTATKNYTYNVLDELTQAGSTSYTYDPDGNETAAASTTMAYDVAGRLKTLTSGSTTTTYTYDGDGVRLKASTGGAANKNTNYLWDTNAALPALVLERDGNNALIRRYLYGTHLISMTTSGGAASYYHYDMVGSVRNLTSSSGATQWTDTYEPFGAIRTETKNNNQAPDNPMKFAGEYLDPTGLYNLRARRYDPSLGRFLAVDPVAGERNEPYGSSYVYAGDDPTARTDPSGMTFTAPTYSLLSAGESTSASSADSPDDLAEMNGGLRRRPYVNPFKYSRSLVPERTDQGVDYKGTGPILAIGNAVIIGDGGASSGWYGHYLLYRLTDGPLAGHFIYVAEGIAPTKTSGKAKVGEVIARFAYAGSPGCRGQVSTCPGIETGWGSSTLNISYARASGLITPDHNNTPPGKAFARFLKYLGAPVRDDPGPGPFFVR